MKPRQFAIFVFLFCLCALLAGGYLLPSKAPIVNVLVAATELTQGSVIVSPEQQVEIRTYSPESVPPNALIVRSDLEEQLRTLKGKILRRTVAKGEAIIPRDFVSLDALLELPTNWRAVTVGARLGYFGHSLPKPGDRVDLIYQGPDPESPEGGTVVRMVLEDVSPLAVCISASREGDEKNLITFTFGVTPEQFEKMGWMYNHPPEYFEVVPHRVQPGKDRD